MAAAKFQRKAAPATKPAEDEGIDPLAALFVESDVGGAKEPLFDVGTLDDVEFLGLERQPIVAGKSAWLKAKFRHDEAGERAALFCLDNKSLGTTLPKIKALICAVINCPDAASYSEFDPKGKFFSAMMGLQNEYSEDAAGYLGTKIRVVTAQGNATKDGSDFYREHSWFSQAE